MRFREDRTLAISDNLLALSAVLNNLKLMNNYNAKRISIHEKRNLKEKRMGNNTTRKAIILWDSKQFDYNFL